MCKGDGFGAVFNVIYRWLHFTNTTPLLNFNLFFSNSFLFLFFSLSPLIILRKQIIKNTIIILNSIPQYLMFTKMTKTKSISHIQNGKCHKYSRYWYTFYTHLIHIIFLDTLYIYLILFYNLWIQCTMILFDTLDLQKYYNKLHKICKNENHVINIIWVHYNAVIHIKVKPKQNQRKKQNQILWNQI